MRLGAATFADSIARRKDRGHGLRGTAAEPERHGVRGLRAPLYHRGRELRELFFEAGFEQVEAATTYFSYGTEERVRTFGLGRAADCRDEWYVDGLTDRGLADQDEIDALEQAWTTWAESPESFAAFAWGRATGRKP